MLDILVSQSKGIVDILNSKVDRVNIRENATRAWNFEDGLVVHNFHQYVIIELIGSEPGFEDQALAMCNIALEHFFANLQEELKGFDNSEGIAEMLAEHKANIQTTLLSSADRVSRMRPNLEYCFIMTAYYHKEALVRYVVTLPQWVNETLTNAVFTHIFKIQL